MHVLIVSRIPTLLQLVKDKLGGSARPVQRFSLIAEDDLNTISTLSSSNTSSSTTSASSSAVAVRDRSLQLIDEADIILADPPALAPLLVQLGQRPPKKLQWLQSTFAGMDALVKNALICPHMSAYKSSRISDIFGEQMSEFVVGQMIGRERSFLEMHKAQEKRQWQKVYQHRTLSQLTVSIIGLGDIGLHVAKTLKHFGATVIGVARTDTHRDRQSQVCNEVYSFATSPSSSSPRELLSQVFSRSDYIISILPNTHETTGIYDDDDLWRACKHNSCFINVGRGSAISESHLLRALDSNHLSSAILDVFATEPLPSDSRLWDHPKVIISPHVSALSLPIDVATIFALNYDRFVTNRDLLYLIDPRRGY